MTGPTADYDVIVIGGGNAGFSAAHAAAERDAVSCSLERGTAEMAGGNSYYTAGATRIGHAGLDDIVDFIEPDERHQRTEVPPYSADEYLADLNKVTEGRNDPELTRVLVTEARTPCAGCTSLACGTGSCTSVRPTSGPTAATCSGAGCMWATSAAGEGLIADHTRVAAKLGIEIRYGTRAPRWSWRMAGWSASRSRTIRATRAARRVRDPRLGRFEANAEWRGEHLGHGWRNAKVRGTPYNTGDMIAAALAIGAAKGGDWSTATACSGTPSRPTTSPTASSPTGLRARVIRWASSSTARVSGSSTREPTSATTPTRSTANGS